LKFKLFFALLLIVLLPLILLGGMGVKVLRDEQRLQEHQIQTLVISQLKEVDRSIGQYFRSLENEFVEWAAKLPGDPATIRNEIQKQPEVRQILIFDSTSKRIFPPGNRPLSQRERQFLERAGVILSRLKSEQAAVTLKSPKKRSSKKVFPSVGSTQGISTNARPDDRSEFQGWQVSYSAAEINHLFWFRDKGGRLIGIELDPVRLQSSLIARLPETGSSGDRLENSRIRLLNSQGGIVYQWGGFQPGSEDSPVGRLSLSHPLGSWKLEYFGAGLNLGAGLQWFNVAGAILVVGAALFGLAFYLYKQHTREMKLAEQRVNFVNQVSHELKTPLTNIRLYSELLEEALPDALESPKEDKRFRNYLDVITAESRRLSRLIANVLNFARSKKERLVLHRQVGVVDEIIKNSLNIFSPLLKAKGVRILFKGGAGDAVEVDPDTLDQILNNIFSNTEKYGASGGRLEIRSLRKEDRTVILVKDDGPGISLHEAERIFQPFYRGSSRLTDGVAGTGIGLGIARDLARLHGGDLTLLPTDRGACFKIELVTPVSGSRV
jgi:signal transduction histidine kinase